MIQKGSKKAPKSSKKTSEKKFKVTKSLKIYQERLENASEKPKIDCESCISHW